MTASVLPTRPRLGYPVTPLAVGALVVLLAVAMVPLAIAARGNPLTLGEGVAITVPFAVVGVLIARRQPGNAIGWLMISPAVFYLLGTDAGLYAVIDYRLGHGLPFGPVALLLYQAWLPMVVLFPLVILLFPDGRLPSLRWRWVLWSYVGLCCSLLALLTAEASSVILAATSGWTPTGSSRSSITRRGGCLLSRPRTWPWPFRSGLRSSLARR